MFWFSVVKAISNPLIMSVSQSGARSQPDLPTSKEEQVKKGLGGISTSVSGINASGTAIVFAGPVADKVSNKYEVKYVTPHLQRRLAKGDRINLANQLQLVC